MSISLMTGEPKEPEPQQLEEPSQKQEMAVPQEIQQPDLIHEVQTSQEQSCSGCERLHAEMTDVSNLSYFS